MVVVVFLVVVATLGTVLGAVVVTFGALLGATVVVAFGVVLGAVVVTFAAVVVAFVVVVATFPVVVVVTLTVAVVAFVVVVGSFVVVFAVVVVTDCLSVPPTVEYQLVSEINSYLQNKKFDSIKLRKTIQFKYLLQIGEGLVY